MIKKGQLRSKFAAIVTGNKKRISFRTSEYSDVKSQTTPELKVTAFGN